MAAKKIYLHDREVLQVRVPAALKQRIALAANTAGLTTTAYVVHILNEYVLTHPVPAVPTETGTKSGGV